MDKPAGAHHFQFRLADPAEPLGREILRDYFREILTRFNGRTATADEVNSAMDDDPSTGMTLPDGVFIVATSAGDPLGCAGLRFHSDCTGEVKRVYVRPAARRHRLGTLLMAEVETHARSHGLTSLRLDTRQELHEALTMYARLGFHSITPYNGSTLADLWLEKAILAPGPDRLIAAVALPDPLVPEPT